MKRDEVLLRLRETRGGFDRRIAAIPRRALRTPAPGSVHSPSETLVHIAAYEELVTARLRDARRGVTTAFDRDRIGWEAFNERVWAEAAVVSANDALSRAELSFRELLEEVASLTDEEIEENAGFIADVDPAWLEGKKLWELIAIDCFEHYPMHYKALEEAAQAAGPADTTDE